MADISENMRDESREQFEAWHSAKTGWLPRHYDFYWSEDHYESEDFQCVWEAWQASRQAVVVELPSLQSVDPFAYHQHGNARVQGHNQCREETRVAIEAQGLRVGVRT